MDKQLTAQQIFKQVYNGHKNFMTPNIVKYFKTKHHAIEVSQGRGISNQNIYGVSVIDLHTMERCKESGNLYQSLTSALYAVSRIKDKDRGKFSTAHLWCTDSEESTEDIEDSEESITDNEETE